MNVYDLGLLLFRDEVLHHPRVKEHLRSTLLSMVAQERRGEIGDRCVGVVYRECRGWDTGVEKGTVLVQVCWGAWCAGNVGVRGWKGTVLVQVCWGAWCAGNVGVRGWKGTVLVQVCWGAWCAGNVGVRGWKGTVLVQVCWGAWCAGNVGVRGWKGTVLVQVFGWCQCIHGV